MPPATPPRLCMFVTNCVSIDTRVVKEAATLVEAGWEVTVVGLREAGQPAREKLEGFTVLRVRHDALHDGAREGRAPSGPFRALAMGFALLDYSLRALWLALAGRFDGFHAHDLPTLPVAWCSARLRRVPVVYDAHELFTEMGRLGKGVRRVLRVLEGALIGSARTVITVNDSIADELSRRYGIRRPVVIQNCPRTRGIRLRREDSALRARLGVGEEVPLVLYQGLYMPQRGLSNLIRAARHFTRARLVLLGWGPYLETLREVARAEALADRVSFLERVPMEELLSYTAGADLGVIPYRNVGLNNYYTSPNKLFEYCAAGVPVVASRFPELVKVVDGLGIGRTFDPERPEDIARAVNELLDDPEALRQARENVARVASRFTWENESHKLIEVYRGLEARP